MMVGAHPGAGKLPRAEHFLRRRQQAFALQLLAGELALATNGFGLFACSLFGGFFIGAARLHFAKHAFALQLLLQNPECLVDIVVSNENLQNYILPSGDAWQHRVYPGVRQSIVIECKIDMQADQPVGLKRSNKKGRA
jgi:hypothetical protein